MAAPSARDDRPLLKEAAEEQQARIEMRAQHGPMPAGGLEADDLLAWPAWEATLEYFQLVLFAAWQKCTSELIPKPRRPRMAAEVAELARASDIGESGASEAELADAFIARIRKMNADMQIPVTVQELKREDFDKIINRAFVEAHGTYAVPRYLTRSDATALLEQLLPEK